MIDHFVRRAKRLLRAGLKPKGVSVTLDGEFTEFIYDPEVAFQVPAFFMDIEVPNKLTIIVTRRTPQQIAPVLHSIMAEVKSFVRFAPLHARDAMDWGLQFETERDLKIGLKHLMQVEDEYAICVAYAPNQKDKP